MVAEVEELQVLQPLRPAGEKAVLLGTFHRPAGLPDVHVQHISRSLVIWMIPVLSSIKSSESKHESRKRAAAHESRSNTAGSAASAALPAAVPHTGIALAHSGPPSSRLPLTSSCLASSGTARLQAEGHDNGDVSGSNMLKCGQTCIPGSTMPEQRLLMRLVQAAGQQQARMTRCPPWRLYDRRCQTRGPAVEGTITSKG